MANDNTLGAPTEGLGQTVTFAFKGADKGQTQARQRGRIQAGVQGNSGGGVVLAKGVQIEDDGTVGMLLKVGASIVNEDIKKARTAAFVSGMQRAMTGEAVEDIAAGQPAWSRVFGDSDAVEGARAYSSEAKVQEVLLGIENNMPNLRRMDSKGANEFFVKSVQTAMTGDPATDNAIMSAVQRNLPAVMKRHASQHYAYMQEEAATQEANALDVAAQRLQGAATQLADGKITQADYDEQANSVSMLAVPAIGRDPEWVRKQRTQSLVLMAERGQFHAMNAMEKLGITSLLHPDQQAAIEKSRQANELQYRSKFGEQFYERIAALKNLAERPTPGWTGNNMMLAMQALNDEYRTRTGSRTDYFNTEVISSYGEKTTQAIAAAQKHQLTENIKAIEAAQKVKDKALEIQATDSLISQAATNGILTTLTGTGKISNDQVNTWFLPRVMPAFSNAMQAKPEDFQLLARNAEGGFVSGPVADQVGMMVASSVRAGEASPTFVNTYEAWRKLNLVSPVAAAAYFKQDHAKFQRFNLGHPGPIDIQNPNPLLQAAFMGSFGPDAPTTRSKLNNKEVEGLVKSVSSNVDQGLRFFRPEWLGGPNKLRPGTAEFIARRLHDTMEVFSVTGSMEDSMKSALAVAPQHGLQIFGGYAWQDKDSKPIYAELQDLVGKDKFGLAAPEETAEDFGAVIDNAIKAHGGIDKANVMRHENMLLITGYKDGANRRIQIDVARIAEDVMKAQKARRAAKAPTIYSDGTQSSWYRFGPELTTQGRADGNTLTAPSPYTSDEDRAYYRKHGKMPPIVRKQLPTDKPQIGRDAPTLGNQ